MIELEKILNQQIQRDLQEKKLNLCEQCGKDMGNEWLLGPVCGKCCRKNHARVIGK